LVGSAAGASLLNQALSWMREAAAGQRRLGEDTTVRARSPSHSLTELSSGEVISSLSSRVISRPSATQVMPAFSTFLPASSGSSDSSASVAMR